VGLEKQKLTKNSSMTMMINKMLAPLVFEGDIFKRMQSLANQANAPLYSGSEPYDAYKDKDDNFILEFALVGLDQEDISVSVSGQTLKIEAGSQQKDDDAEFYHRKISRRSVKKHFTLHQNVDKDSIQAEYKNGLLRVKIPLEKEEKKDIMIEVK
jgi:HSP20 family molecular chaperone IbpA